MLYMNTQKKIKNKYGENIFLNFKLYFLYTRKKK